MSPGCSNAKTLVPPDTCSNLKKKTPRSDPMTPLVRLHPPQRPHPTVSQTVHWTELISAQVRVQAWTGWNLQHTTTAQQHWKPTGNRSKVNPVSTSQLRNPLDHWTKHILYGLIYGGKVLVLSSFTEVFISEQIRPADIKDGRRIWWNTEDLSLRIHPKVSWIQFGLWMW